MKRSMLVLLMCLTLALSACAAPATVAANPTVVPAAASSTAALNADYPDAAPVEMQLLLGTLSLGGDLAISPEQAATLLPLWTQIQSLSMGMGSTAAQPGAAAADVRVAQIDALLAQIEAALTPEQLAAIAAMQITQGTAMTMMQHLGLTPGGQPFDPPPPQLFDAIIQALGGGEPQPE